MSQARGLQRRPLVSRSIPGLKLKPKTGSIAQSVGKSTLQNTKAKMKPGKERPASSCFSIQGLRSGASPKKWAKSKTLGAQGMLRRPRALLVPISSEPVRRIGLGSSSGHDPKRTLSPYHTRGTRRPAIQLKVKTILNGPKPFRRLLDSFTNHPRKEPSFILCLSVPSGSSLDWKTLLHSASGRGGSASIRSCGQLVDDLRSQPGRLASHTACP